MSNISLAALTFVVLGSVNVFSPRCAASNQYLEAEIDRIVGILCDAKNLKKCVALHYGGHDRIVEVHAVGRNKETRNTLLRCFQVSGGSNSGQPIAWKLMTVSKISNCSFTELASKAPRPQYNPNGSAMTASIICHV